MYSVRNSSINSRAAFSALVVVDVLVEAAVPVRDAYDEGVLCHHVPHMPRRYDYTAPCGDEEEGCHEVRGLYAADAAACALFSQQPVAGVGTEWLPGIGDDKCLARQLVQGDKRLRHKRVARRQDGIGAVTVYEPPHDARWQLGIFAGREHQIISRAERGWSVLSDDVIMFSSGK